MKHVYSTELKKHVGKLITVHGFARKIRAFGKLTFIVLWDREGETQIVINEPRLLKQSKLITNESCLEVKGLVKKNQKAPSGYELIAKEIKIVTIAKTPVPLDMSGKIKSGIDKRLDWRYLDLRTRKGMLIMKIWTTIEEAMRQYLLKKGFMQMHSPKLLAQPSEGGGEEFPVVYFDKEAFLAQSPQFYKQMALIAGFDKVFEVGPVFRAEPSHTTRHIAEYTGIDVEFAWINGVEDVMKFEEEWLASVIKKVKEIHGKDIEEVFSVKMKVPKTPFPRITMKEAQKIVKSMGGEVDPTSDLDSQGERLLGEHVKKELKHDFVFLTEFPWSKRPFYHMESTKTTTRSFDLIYGGVEITTGAQREHRYEVLLKQIKKKKLSKEKLEFFLNFFKYGAPPHGGFGVGIDRVIKQMLGLENIREVCYLTRDLKRLTP